MRTVLAELSICALLLPMAALGQSKSTCEHSFEAKLEPGADLRMHVRSGDVEIIGVDSPRLRVSCELKRPGEAGDVEITFRRNGNSGDLRIRGGPDNDIRFRIEVPRKSNLTVRSPAGDMNISGVLGDKDVQLHAGDLTISVGNAADYKHAEASVWAGNLTATAFGVNKDGLFRSFAKDNPGGRYRLEARLWAGDLVLK